MPCTMTEGTCPVSEYIVLNLCLSTISCLSCRVYLVPHVGRSGVFPPNARLLMTLMLPIVKCRIGGQGGNVAPVRKLLSQMPSQMPIALQSNHHCSSNKRSGTHACINLVWTSPPLFAFIVCYFSTFEFICQFTLIKSRTSTFISVLVLVY